MSPEESISGGIGSGGRACRDVNHRKVPPGLCDLAGSDVVSRTDVKLLGEAKTALPPRSSDDSRLRGLVGKGVVWTSPLIRPSQLMERDPKECVDVFLFRDAGEGGSVHV